MDEDFLFAMINEDLHEEARKEEEHESSESED